MSRTIPSFAEEGLKRFLHGMDRRVRDLERRGDWRFDSETLTDEEIIARGSSAHLIAMAATADSVASGGDYVTFTSVLAQYGFTGTSSASSAWVHPTGGVYVLTYEHAWDSYVGGGTIELEVDGVVAPDATIAGATSGQEGRGTIVYVATEGSSGKIKVTQSSGSAQTCDAVVRVAISDPIGSGTTGAALDSFWVDSTDIAGTTSSISLATGQAYRVVVTGNFDPTGEETFPYGNPDAVMWPSAGKSVTQAAADADTYYASSVASDTGGHFAYLRMNLGSGTSHVEPDGGAVTVPPAGHVYEYTVTGQDSPLTVSVYDSDGAHSLNNGQLRVDIYAGGS